MIDPRTTGILQQTFRRLGRSLLQYVRDSFPWTTADEKGVPGQLQQMAAEEAQAAGRLVQFLLRCHLPVPHLGSYPASFTTINYVSVDFLLPMLVAAQRQSVGTLEQQLAGVDHPDARLELQAALDLQQRHLKALEGLAVSTRPTAAVH